jgi:hypothetical protein
MVVELHAFLTFALDSHEWSFSRLGRFNPEKKGHRYPLDRSLGGTQNRYGGSGKIKNPFVQPIDYSLY